MKPEAFRKWVTSEVLPSIRKTGSYRLKERHRYQQLGLSPEWIEKREEGIIVRKQFTDILKEHGLDEGWEFARITNTLYYPTLGPPPLSSRRGWAFQQKPISATTCPFLNYTVGMAELLAQRKIETEDRQGFEAVRTGDGPGSDNVANAVKFTEDAGRLPPPA